MTAIKICGVTSLADALAAAEAGVDLIGFNFYPASPRCIALERCAEISAQLALHFPRVLRVGVFVNLPAAEVRRCLEQGGLQLAQLHGDESPADRAACGSQAYKALRSVCENIEAYVRPGAPALLLDACVAGAYGGTGQRADWSAAAELARRAPLLLAGGLTPANVAAAIRQVRPWGVDVASGVESRPGIKDHQQIRALVAAVRAADAALAQERERNANHFGA